VLAFTSLENETVRITREENAENGIIIKYRTEFDSQLKLGPQSFS